jgi:hypothetical protein
LALYDENLDTLERRIARLETGCAWSEDPPSRTRWLITNIEVEPIDIASEIDGSWKITSRGLVLDQTVISKNLGPGELRIARHTRGQVEERALRTESKSTPAEFAMGPGERLLQGVPGGAALFGARRRHRLWCHLLWFWSGVLVVLLGTCAHTRCRSRNRSRRAHHSHGSDRRSSWRPSARTTSLADPNLPRFSCDVGHRSQGLEVEGPFPFALTNALALEAVDFPGRSGDFHVIAKPIRHFLSPILFG